MELTPRTGPDGDAPAPRRRRVSLPALAVLVAVLAVGSFVVLQALGSATTFYRNVDEAVEQRDDIGTKRFRLQGTVVPGTIVRTGDGVQFEVAYNGVGLNVRHVGDPPEMFKESEAVLLEGRFGGSDPAVFDSDLMIVKHSEVYEEKQSGRLDDAQAGGTVPVTTVEGGS